MTDYKFIPWLGWQLTKDGRQITIRSIATFKTALTDEQFVSVAASLKEYLLSREEENEGLPELLDEEHDRRFEGWISRSKIMEVPQSLQCWRGLQVHVRRRALALVGGPSADIAGICLSKDRECVCSR